LAFACSCCSSSPFPRRHAPTIAAVQTTWRLLDYLAVDYPGAVRDGRIVSQAEYDEMREFLGLGGRAARRLARSTRAGGPAHGGA
jgi:high-affinity iron transporter